VLGPLPCVRVRSTIRARVLDALASCDLDSRLRSVRELEQHRALLPGKLLASLDADKRSLAHDVD
jgi:hypothetical protein